MNARGVFVTGTDTNVGKTLTSALLVSALARAGLSSGYFKPVQTGSDSDTETVAWLAGQAQFHIATPAYFFPEPIAPSRAALKNGAEIQLGRIREKWASLEPRAWVVEGAGGLLVPLNRRQTILDLIAELGLPALLISSTRLGTINHTLLSLQALVARGITVAGIVLNGEEDPGLAETLSDFTPVPVIAAIPPLPSVTPEKVHALSSEIFRKPLLESFFSYEGPGR